MESNLELMQNSGMDLKTFQLVNETVLRLFGCKVKNIYPYQSNLWSAVSPSLVQDQRKLYVGSIDCCVTPTTKISLALVDKNGTQQNYWEVDNSVGAPVDCATRFTECLMFNSWGNNSTYLNTNFTGWLVTF